MIKILYCFLSSSLHYCLIHKKNRLQLNNMHQAILTYEQSTIDYIVIATVTRANLLAGDRLVSPYI